MASKQERIANLLARDMRPTMVCAIVGVTASYVSQLLRDQAFAYMVEEIRKELAEEERSAQDAKADEEAFLGDKLLGLEHKILDKVADDLQYMTGREALVALDVVGKRRAAHKDAELKAGMAKALGSGELTAPLVTITIPVIAAPELTFSSTREIIAIGDKSTAPMAATQLKTLLAAQAPEGRTYETHDAISEAL